MPLYIGDYLADTADLDAEWSGAYLHLLMHYWRQGPLPDNLAKLQSISKLTSSNATSILQGLLDQYFFKNGDGRWHQKRIEQEKVKWDAKRMAAKEKAQKAANERWGKIDAPSIPPSSA